MTTTTITKTNKERLGKTFEERARNARMVCQFAAMMAITYQEAIEELLE